MMRYSEFTRELSSDSLGYKELGNEDYIYKNINEENPPDVNSTYNNLNQTIFHNEQLQQQQHPEHKQQCPHMTYNSTFNNVRDQQQQHHNLPYSPTVTPQKQQGICSIARNAYQRNSKRYSYSSNSGNGTANGAATISYVRQRKDSTKSTQSCHFDMERLTQSASKAQSSKSSRRKNSIGCLNTLSSSPDSPGCYYSISNGVSPSCKSQSLPAHASMKTIDNVILNALRVSADELANQITLLDLPVFAGIQPDELTSCAWTKKDKHVVTPNIVAFTKRFNHTSFWTVQEILSGEQPKQRAEILIHFIKVAKKLHELNNLHSLFAIISAMQSASIYRLKKTWSCLSKKDKQSFDRLSDIFSDQNNWENLRQYLESLRLPCIPYLGLFLTDLIYIDLAHPHKGGLEPEQRRNKMNNILRVISNYQQSDYSNIQPIEGTQKYLTSIRYIEELQNIFEEDQYKRSLKLEPTASSGPSSSSCSSKESFNIDIVTPTLACLNLSPAKTIGSMRLASGNKFIPGHRKCRSLGTKFRSTSLPRNFVEKCHCSILMVAPSIGTISNKRCKCRIFGKMSNDGIGQQHNKSTKINCTDEHHKHNHSLLSQQPSRHLLDDSLLEHCPHHHFHHHHHHQHHQHHQHQHHSHQCPAHQHTINGVVAVDATSIDSGESGLCPFLDMHQTPIDGNLHYLQGCVRRKTVQKEGRKPAVASWQRYWLHLWANSLVYFPPKSFKGSERIDFKREPCKVCPLDGWSAYISDNPKHKNTFELHHRISGTIYKFRTDSAETTCKWKEVINIIATQHNAPQPLPVNLMSFE